MMKGELQTDNLYTSAPWTVGLKRYAQALKENEMYFYFIPMQKDAPYLSYLDKEVVPNFGDKNEFLDEIDLLKRVVEAIEEARNIHNTAFIGAINILNRIIDKKDPAGIRKVENWEKRRSSSNLIHR